VSNRRCGFQIQRDARVLVNLMCASQPFMTAVRLEAAYQHYARYQLMDGHVPMIRRLWWYCVFDQDPIFAAQLVAEPDELLKDVEGVQL